MALQAEEVWPLRTLIRDAMRAAPRSELELAGTIGGVPFEVGLETDKVGRVTVNLEGFVFDDQRQLREFLAPFVGVENLEELELNGQVAGRKIRTTLESSR